MSAADPSRPAASATRAAAAGGPRSLAGLAAKGALWVSLEMAVVQLTSFAVLIVMARLIGPSDFGLMSIAFMAVQSLKYLLLDNVATAVARKPQAEAIDYTTAFWITLALSLVGSLLL